MFTSSCRHDFIDLWLPVNQDPHQILSGTWSSSVNLKVLQSISSSGRSLPLQRRRAALAGELCLWRLREDRGGSRDLLREEATDRPTCGRTDGLGQRERKQVVVCLQKWNACFLWLSSNPGQTHVCVCVRAMLVVDSGFVFFTKVSFCKHVAVPLFLQPLC